MDIATYCRVEFVFFSALYFACPASNGNRQSIFIGIDISSSDHRISVVFVGSFEALKSFDLSTDTVNATQLQFHRHFSKSNEFTIPFLFPHTSWKQTEKSVHFSTRMPIQILYGLFNCIAPSLALTYTHTDVFILIRHTGNFAVAHYVDTATST